MSSRASGSALAASLILAAIIGFAGGAWFGTQAGADEPGPTSTATTPGSAAGPTNPTPDSADPTTETPAGGLQLDAEPKQVSPNARVAITGSITPAERGVKVQLQRSVEGGPWEDFNVSPWTTGQDGTFSGEIQSQRPGVNSLRVVRVDDPDVMSNVVDVVIR